MAITMTNDIIQSNEHNVRNNIQMSMYVFPCRSAAKAEFKLRGYAPQVRRMDIGVI